VILFQIIQKPQNRGAEIFAAQLSEHLEKLGHTVILISLFEGVSELPFSGKKIQLNRPISKRWYDYEAWQQIARLVKEFKPDIIQCNAGDTLKFMILSKLFFGWKVPVIARNASTVSSYIKSTPTKIINHFFYKKVDAIISVSKFSAEDINILFPFTKKKTFVIPVGIDEKITNHVEWKKQLNNSINVVHVGGFTFEKNHSGLLRIWKLFLESKPNAILHLLGDGPMKQKIEEEVIKMNLSDSIIFYGWTANPLDYIIKADMLVLPSIIEGLPGVILEAMYCRTTVVANDVGGINEIIEHKQTGFLVGKNDELNFVNSMQEALTIDNMVNENAYHQVLNHYTNKNIAKDFEKTYTIILNQKFNYAI